MSAAEKGPVMRQAGGRQGRETRRASGNAAFPNGREHPGPSAPNLSVLPIPIEASPDPRRWQALAAILTAAFLGPLDFFIVNVSIPVIRERLHADYAQVQLMIATYGLSYAIFLITGGRLGDIFGRKRMFLLGGTGFTLASILCGLAPTPPSLIAARIIQGLAGALMFPQVLSIIQVTFPPWERGAAFGLMGVVMGTASFAGNVIGGLLLRADLFGLGWRPIFLVNLPVGLVALPAAWKLLRESRSPSAVRLDLGGVAIVTPALFLLVYPLVEGREAGWPAWAFVSLAASLPVLAAFVLYERRLARRGGAPLMDLGLFRDRVFVTGLLTSVGFYGGLSVFFLATTLFLQNGLGFSPVQTGLIFAPFALGFLASSRLAVRVTYRLGRRTIQLGSALMIAALVSLVALTRLYGAGVSAYEMVPLLLIYGVGQGFVMPTLLTIVLSGIPGASAGSASGVLTTVQQVAMSLGVAVVGTMFFAVLGAHPQAEGFAHAIGTAFLCNIGMLIVTVALVFLLPRGAARHSEVSAAAEI